MEVVTIDDKLAKLGMLCREGAEYPWVEQFVMNCFGAEHLNSRQIALIELIYKEETEE